MLLGLNPMVVHLTKSFLRQLKHHIQLYSLIHHTPFVVRIRLLLVFLIDYQLLYL